MNAYSQWFFSYGWMIVSAIGFGLGLRVGLKAYYVILPLVCVAVLGRIGGVA
jgi:hypothetical protein